jgi:hypothetical protein
MSEYRIVVVSPCEHGETRRHAYRCDCPEGKHRYIGCPNLTCNHSNGRREFTANGPVILLPDEGGVRMEPSGAHVHEYCEWGGPKEPPPGIEDPCGNCGRARSGHPYWAGVFDFTRHAWRRLDGEVSS